MRFLHPTWTLHIISLFFWSMIAKNDTFRFQNIMGGFRGVGEGAGVRTFPGKSQVAIGFLRNTCTLYGPPLGPMAS